MTRSLIIALAFAAFAPIVADAQHHHGGFGPRVGYFPWMVYPGYGYPGYFGYPDPYWPQPRRFNPNYYWNPATVVPIVPVVAAQPVNPPMAGSTVKAKMRSLEHVSHGDRKMREKKWGEAREEYRTAVDIAPDQAEARLKLAVCSIVIQRFDTAIREMKRAISTDPNVIRNTKFVESVFGEGSQMIRMSVTAKLTDWVNMDIANTDRLFLLGSYLILQNDARSHEFLVASLKLKGGGEVGYLLTAIDAAKDVASKAAPAKDLKAPQLNPNVVPLVPKKLGIDILFPKADGVATMKPVEVVPGGPVPMPDL
jgi:tetratricopeptide (TPR) repeat protein